MYGQKCGLGQGVQGAALGLACPGRRTTSGPGIAMEGNKPDPNKGVSRIPWGTTQRWPTIAIVPSLAIVVNNDGWAAGL